MNGDQQDQTREAQRGASPTTPLIVGFSSAEYLPVLANWLIGLSRIGVDNIKVYALDRKTFECLEQWDIRTEYVDWDGDVANLWRLRADIFCRLVESGVEFVHSDSDAIWLKNPFSGIGAFYPAADLVYSQGTVWPHDVHERQGFVLCCGWFYARPTPATKKFFAELARDVARTGNDQTSVNNLLVDQAIEWSAPRETAYEQIWRNRVFDCWTTPNWGICPGDGPTVVLLPHREFQRIEETYDDINVQHLLSPKNATEKLAMLERHGLLFLKSAKTRIAGASLGTLARGDIEHR